MSTQITSGFFTNVASQPFFIPLSQQIDEFRLVNLTRSGITAGGITGVLTSDRIVEAEYFPRYMARDTALIKQNGTVAGVIAPVQNGVLPQQGFQIFNGANQPKGPNIAVSSFVPGSPTVFTTGANHGFIVGDNVRLFGMTSSPEIGGLIMTVTAVGSPTTFTTLLNSNASLTSVGFVYRVGNANLPQPALYYPEWRVIASITATNPMVVTTLVRQIYQVGDVVRFNIPQTMNPATSVSGYGMGQLNTGNSGLPVEFTVIAVNNAIGTQTVTLAVDATAFTAFAWPVASAYPLDLPTMIPQGEGNINNFQGFGVVPAPLPYGNQNILGFATQNQAQNGILIGAGLGTNAVGTGGIIGSTVDAWEWRAITSLQVFP